MSDWRETIARRPCTPPLPLEAFNENISASTGSSKEIAGLKKKKKKNMTKIVKSGISVFSPGESKVGINTWGLCTARDGPESCCWCVLNPRGV